MTTTRCIFELIKTKRTHNTHTHTQMIATCIRVAPTSYPVIAIESRDRCWGCRRGYLVIQTVQHKHIRSVLKKTGSCWGFYRAWENESQLAKINTGWECHEVFAEATVVILAAFERVFHVSLAFAPIVQAVYRNIFVCIIEAPILVEHFVCPS